MKRLILMASCWVLAASSFSYVFVGAFQAPSWITAQWTYDDSKFKSIRDDLEELWSRDQIDERVITSLYKSKVLPNMTQYRTAQVTGKLDPTAYYWLIGLESYFGHLGIMRKLGQRVETDILLDEVPAPASYEFARVAFGVYLREAGYRDQNRDLPERLLAAWKKDPLVRMYYVLMDLRTSGEGVWLTRAPEMAEELYREYPKRVELFLPLFRDSLYSAWRGTNKSDYLKRAIKCCDEEMKRSEPFFVKGRKTTALRRKLYLDESKAAGLKL